MRSLRKHVYKYKILVFIYCKTHLGVSSLLTDQSCLVPVPEDVARLNVNLEDVNSFLFTHHSNKEPMVFHVPNKAVRNSLKLHVNVSEGVVCRTSMLPGDACIVHSTVGPATSLITQYGLVLALGLDFTFQICVPCTCTCHTPVMINLDRGERFTGSNFHMSPY